MVLYNKILTNTVYLDTIKKIDNIKFIENEKWDWEHGFAHSKRVAKYTKKILSQLQADKRTIDLGMSAALLHDIGLSKGSKIDHDIESSKIFTKFIDKNDISNEEEIIIRQAILDHSKGKNIKSLVGLALVLADKLDITYHRTINSSIQDTINKEIQKIRKLDINISNTNLILSYKTISSFDFNILLNWPKAITIPYEIAKYLNKNFIFLINNEEIDIKKFINQ